MNTFLNLSSLIYLVDSERKNKEEMLMRCKQSIQNLQAEIMRAQEQLPEVRMRIERNSAEVTRHEEKKAAVLDEMNGSILLS